MSKGYIIVIEGTDGSGKQTQATLLKSKLSALTKGKVFEISFPNYKSDSSAPVKMYLGGKLGSTANSVDAYQASALFAVDRLCTYLDTIKEHYDNGEIIIIDRYTPSNALHQAGKITDTTQKDKFLDWLFDLEYNTLKLPKPDKVFFLNVPIDVSKRLREERAKINTYKSGTAKDIHEEDPKHLENAYNTGLYVSYKYGWDVITCIDEYDNILPIETINKAIFNTLRDDPKFNKLTKK